MSPRIYTRPGAANHLHREHPQAMRHERIHDPRYDMRWPEEIQGIDVTPSYKSAAGLVRGALIGGLITVVVALGIYGAFKLGWL